MGGEFSFGTIEMRSGKGGDESRSIWLTSFCAQQNGKQGEFKNVTEANASAMAAAGAAGGSSA